MTDEAQERAQTKSKRRGSVAALVGVLTVLIPAAILGYAGWRMQAAESSSSLQRVAEAEPRELVETYYHAVSDDEQELAQRALSADLRRSYVADEGMRGIQDIVVASFSEQGDKAQAVVRFVTVRPLAGGQPPGPLRQLVELRRIEGRWYITQLSTPER